MYLYLFQVEHLEVPSSQDKIFVFLHRGAMVGGKEVNKCVQKRSSRNDLHQLSPHAMERLLYGCPSGISNKYNVDDSLPNTPGISIKRKNMYTSFIPQILISFINTHIPVPMC